MTQQEWENASEEERNAEIERCMDPHYFYSTYWVDKNGNYPPHLTKKEFDERMAFFDKCQSKGVMQEIIPIVDEMGRTYFNLQNLRRNKL